MFAVIGVKGLFAAADECPNSAKSRLRHFLRPAVKLIRRLRRHLLLHQKRTQLCLVRHAGGASEHGADGEVADESSHPGEA